MLALSIQNNVKTTILNCAKNIAKEQGLHNMNIRTVAKQAGIAIGTIYNYYPTKDSLILAVCENFWKSAFETIDFTVFQTMDFLDALEYLYYQLADYLKDFKENWIDQLSKLDIKNKKIGKYKEAHYLDKLRMSIIIALKNNVTICTTYSHDELEKISLFIFDNFIILLKKDEQDFTFFKKILEKILC